MVYKIRSLWARLLARVDEFSDKRKGITAIMEEEDTEDQLEIQRTERFIVGQQYLSHMARARIKGREEWRRLQAEKAAIDNASGQTQ